MSPAAPAAETRAEAEVHARFRADVLAGLRRRRKALPSRWLYDAAGSALFERICATPEYYPTRTELALMAEHAPAMGAALGPGCLVVEYGSGVAVKTRLLLAALERCVGYVPVDISPSALAEAAATIRAALPGLPVLPVCADFGAGFALPASPTPPARIAAYFPGSTIGNCTAGQAARFLRRIAWRCGSGGALLIGIDLVKERRILEAAYDDAAGVTAAFNRNLLRRIATELGGDLDPERFRHQAVWDPLARRVEMRLVARAAHVATVAGEPIAFAAGEWIRSEYSHKYTVPGFAALARRAGWRLAERWSDPRGWFAVALLTRP